MHVLVPPGWEPRPKASFLSLSFLFYNRPRGPIATRYTRVASRELDPLGTRFSDSVFLGCDFFTHGCRAWANKSVARRTRYTLDTPET